MLTLRLSKETSRSRLRAVFALAWEGWAAAWYEWLALFVAFVFCLGLASVMLLAIGVGLWGWWLKRTDPDEYYRRHTHWLRKHP